MLPFIIDNPMHFMSAKKQGTSIIPFFPLGVSMLPGEDLPLRIFEPRYKQLIEDCDREEITFGIPYVDHHNMHKQGCEVSLDKILAKNERNEMVIVVKCVALFRMKSFKDTMPGKLYSGGEIEYFSVNTPIRSERLKKLIRSYRISSEHPEFPAKIDKSSVLKIARILNLPSDLKYRFITLPDPESREDFLADQVQYLIHLREQELRLRDDFQQN